jgi:hypothetical protein
MPRSQNLNSLPTLGVYKNWPDKVAAEHESIERFKLSAGLLGINLEIVNDNGETKSGTSPDFIFALHFETGKTWPQPSIHPLWNPIDYLYDRGFAQNILNSCSHTFLASGGSTINDNRINEYRGLLRNPILSRFLPTLDAPIIEPSNLKNRRLFYAGINWERITGKTRFGELLNKLDSMGILDLYGPKEMFGVEVWRGFKSYKGELPFDGSSLVKTAARSGVYLCLTSEIHLHSQLLSNRLFEACASGNVIISNYHEGAHKIFGDSILWLKSNSESEMFSEILEHLKWLNQNPKLARLLAEKSQAIFKKSFLLSEQILMTVREASAANKQYLREFERFNQSMKSAEGSSTHKDWISPARQPLELIPHAIGRILLSVKDIDSSIDVIVGPWIARSPQSAVQLMPHNVRYCPFCLLSIGDANTLVRNHSVLVTQNFQSHITTYTSEPFLFHQCKNWINFEGKISNYDLDLSRIGLSITASHTLIPHSAYNYTNDSMRDLRSARKRKYFLKVSKKSFVYRYARKWTSGRGQNFWIRKFAILVYLKFLAIPEEL